MINIGISVIICCYNSADRLPETLKHLAAQRVSEKIKWEVIIVDNASSDSSSKIAQQEWAKYKINQIPFNVVNESCRGLRYAREKGLICAKYEYLLYCDDDNWLAPQYLSMVFEILTHDAQIGVLGGCGTFEPEKPVWQDIEKFKSNYVNGSQPYAAEQHWVYGAGSTYKKSILTYLYSQSWQPITKGRTGNKLSSGEDVEICFICFLLGYKIIADDRLSFKHFVPIKRQNETYITNMSFWHGYTNVLLNGYYTLINRTEIPLKININAWYASAGKALIKQTLLLLFRKTRSLTKLSIEDKMAFQSSLGTFISLLRNRKKVVIHQRDLIALLHNSSKTYQQPDV